MDNDSGTNIITRQRRQQILESTEKFELFHWDENYFKGYQSHFDSNWMDEFLDQDNNPLNLTPFHQLSFTQRTHILLALLESYLNNCKPIHNHLKTLDAAQLRPHVLGTDNQDCMYWTLNDMPDLRIYRQRPEEQKLQPYQPPPAAPITHQSTAKLRRSQRGRPQTPDITVTISESDIGDIQVPPEAKETALKRKQLLHVITTDNSDLKCVANSVSSLELVIDVLSLDATSSASVRCLVSNLQSLLERRKEAESALFDRLSEARFKLKRSIFMYGEVSELELFKKKARKRKRKQESEMEVLEEITPPPRAKRRPTPTVVKPTPPQPKVNPVTVGDILIRLRNGGNQSAPTKTKTPATPEKHPKDAPPTAPEKQREPTLVGSLVSRKFAPYVPKEPTQTIRRKRFAHALFGVSGTDPPPPKKSSAIDILTDKILAPLERTASPNRTVSKKIKMVPNFIQPERRVPTSVPATSATVSTEPTTVAMTTTAATVVSAANESTPPPPSITPTPTLNIMSEPKKAKMNLVKSVTAGDAAIAKITADIQSSFQKSLSGDYQVPEKPKAPFTMVSTPAFRAKMPVPGPPPQPNASNGQPSTKLRPLGQFTVSSSLKGGSKLAERVQKMLDSSAPPPRQPVAPPPRQQVEITTPPHSIYFSPPQIQHQPLPSYQTLVSGLRHSQPPVQVHNNQNVMLVPTTVMRNGQPTIGMLAVPIPTSPPPSTISIRPVETPTPTPSITIDMGDQQVTTDELEDVVDSMEFSPPLQENLISSTVRINSDEQLIADKDLTDDEGSNSLPSVYKDFIEKDIIALMPQRKTTEVLPISGENPEDDVSNVGEEIIDSLPSVIEKEDIGLSPQKSTLIPDVFPIDDHDAIFNSLPSVDKDFIAASTDVIDITSDNGPVDAVVAQIHEICKSSKSVPQQISSSETSKTPPPTDLPPTQTEPSAENPSQKKKKVRKPKPSAPMKFKNQKKGGHLNFTGFESGKTLTHLEDAIKMNESMSSYVTTELEPALERMQYKSKLPKNPVVESPPKTKTKAALKETVHRKLNRRKNTR